MLEVDEKTLDAVLRRIDTEAYTLKLFIEECTKEGSFGGETQIRYVHCYNTLVCLRQKMTPEGVRMTENWDNTGVQATKRISLERHPDGQPYLNYFE